MSGESADAGSDLPGRPFWQIPRRFVIGEHGESGPWAALPLSAKGVLPPLMILSNGHESGVGLDRLAKCCGARSSVVDGLRALERVGLIERERRQNYFGGWKRSQTKLAPQLIADGEAFGRFDRALVTGGAWRELRGSARALLVCLLCGVQHDAFKAWAGASKAHHHAGDGSFDWQGFHREAQQEPGLLHTSPGLLPLVSFRPHDKGRIGIGTLRYFSGLSEPTIRPALAQLHELRLVLCLKPCPSHNWHRFILPHVYDWELRPGFLRKGDPRRAWEDRATHPADTPF